MFLVHTTMVLKRIIFLIILSTTNGASGDDCVWNKDTDFPKYPPLLMDPYTWKSILPVLTDGIREVRVESGADVVIACPKTTLSSLGIEVVEGVCHGGNVLLVGSENYTMEDLGCTSRVKESLKKNITTCANGKGFEQLIGYVIPGYPFYDLIRVCFDFKSERTFYTNHILRGPSVTGSDSNPSRPSFRVDSGFYTVSPSVCYEVSEQKEMMTALLGYPNVIDESKNYYFARGHLSPDADFDTEMEEDASYYYINAVPQWQVFNSRNWVALENDVRSMAAQHGTDLEIWTGIWEVLRLVSEKNKWKNIYLGYVQEQKVIPAPKYMWKVIYERSTNRGVAVIGLNNPYAKRFPKQFCTDICDMIEWLDFDFRNLVAGATYCCTVQALHEVIPYAPDLGDAGLLDV